METKENEKFSYEVFELLTKEVIKKIIGSLSESEFLSIMPSFFGDNEALGKVVYKKFIDVVSNEAEQYWDVLSENISLPAKYKKIQDIVQQCEELENVNGDTMNASESTDFCQQILFEENKKTLEEKISQLKAELDTLQMQVIKHREEHTKVYQEEMHRIKKEIRDRIIKMEETISVQIERTELLLNTVNANKNE